MIQARRDLRNKGRRQEHCPFDAHHGGSRVSLRPRCIGTCGSTEDLGTMDELRQQTERRGCARCSIWYRTARRRPHDIRIPDMEKPTVSPGRLSRRGGRPPTALEPGTFLSHHCRFAFLWSRVCSPLLLASPRGYALRFTTVGVLGHTGADALVRAGAWSSFS